MNDSVQDYLINYGKSGHVGRFVAPQPLTVSRGQRVVIESDRGLEVGVVLCPAGASSERLLPQTFVGRVARRLHDADEAVLEQVRGREEQFFGDSRQLAQTLGLSIEILDVEILLDGQIAIVQYLLAGDADLDDFAKRLEQRHQVTVRLENLAVSSEPEAETGGCGKPDCGRAEGGGGCTSCGGGGCGTCGSHKVDLRPYFAHLRSQMEQAHRTPLV